MKLLKSLRKRSSVAVYLIYGLLTICSLAAGDQAHPPIDLNVVRKDMVAYGEGFVPNDAIESVNAEFSIFYLDAMCLVHLRFKDAAADAANKSSMVAVYTLDGKRWKFSSILPYNYEISLLSKEHHVFLSAGNQVCSFDGDCSLYTELTVFRNGALEPVGSYEGFDRSVYFDGLLTQEEFAKIRKTVGDTILDVTTVENVTVGSKGVKSYDALRETGVLMGIATDSLVIRKVKTKKRITL